MPPPLRVLSPIHKASRQVADFLDPKMAALGAVAPECHLLAYLHSYAPCPIAQLIRVFGIKQSTMTSMLDRLEKRKLIRRALSAADRRSFEISISAAGRRLARRIRKEVDAFERAVLGRVSERQLEGFHAVFTAIEELTKNQTES